MAYENAEPGYSLGGPTEGLSREHFGFAAAAERVQNDSHLTEEDSAQVAERDSRNTVNIRPNQFVTVEEKPFDEEEEPEE